jgi:ERCC4-type nuclease
MTEKEKVEPVIDSNEASMNPDIVTKVALHEDTEDYRIEPLSEGDLIIDDCIFERKTPSDFASSLQEGRLRDQVERMGGGGGVCFILIEGNMEDYDNLEHSEMPSKSLRGMDASIEMRNNIGVKYCSNLKNLVDMAVRIARKSKEETTTVQANTTDAVKDPSFMENLFLGIDGVGIKTAEELALLFSDIESLHNSNIEDFKQVNGVGDETAKEIQEVVHKSSNSNNIEETTSKQQRTYSI